MKKLLLLAALVLFAGNAAAQVLCEDFPDPLGDWRDRWLAQNSDMRNYYVCSGGSDENNRGNNPCGIWICDGDNNFQSADVEFDAGFGATVTNFEIGIMAFVAADFTMYDSNNNISYSSSVTVDGTFPPCPTNFYGGPTDGLSRFSISPTGGSQIEGNTSVDDVCATTGGVNPTEETSWGQIKSMYSN